MRRKPKYSTVQVSWADVKPGMLMACPGGYDRVVNCAKLQDGRWQISFERQAPVIAAEGNWPEQAIPIISEYETVTGCPRSSHDDPTGGAR